MNKNKYTLQQIKNFLIKSITMNDKNLDIRLIENNHDKYIKISPYNKSIEVIQENINEKFNLLNSELYINNLLNPKDTVSLYLFEQDIEKELGTSIDTYISNYGIDGLIDIFKSNDNLQKIYYIINILNIMVDYKFKIQELYKGS